MKEKIVLGKLLVRNISFFTAHCIIVQYISEQRIMIKTTNCKIVMKVSQIHLLLSQTEKHKWTALWFATQVNILCMSRLKSFSLKVPWWLCNGWIFYQQSLGSTRDTGLEAASCQWIEMRKIQTVPKCHFILNSSLMVSFSVT